MRSTNLDIEKTRRLARAASVSSVRKRLGSLVMNRWIPAVSVAIVAVVATPVVLAVTPVSSGTVAGAPIAHQYVPGQSDRPARERRHRCLYG